MPTCIQLGVFACDWLPASTSRFFVDPTSRVMLRCQEAACLGLSLFWQIERQWLAQLHAWGRGYLRFPLVVARSSGHCCLGGKICASASALFPWLCFNACLLYLLKPAQSCVPEGRSILPHSNPRLCWGSASNHSTFASSTTESTSGELRSPRRPTPNSVCFYLLLLQLFFSLWCWYSATI